MSSIGASSFENDRDDGNREIRHIFLKEDRKKKVARVLKMESNTKVSIQKTSNVIDEEFNTNYDNSVMTDDFKASIPRGFQRYSQNSLNVIRKRAPWLRCRNVWKCSRNGIVFTITIMSIIFLLTGQVYSEENPSEVAEAFGGRYTASEAADQSMSSKELHDLLSDGTGEVSCF